jgi:asparagine synthase (glutamine-hydrolysing)
VSSKLCGLREKLILRRWASNVVPPSVTARHKQPYRAPDIPAFFDAANTGGSYVTELLEPDALRKSSLFDATAVTALVARCRAGRASSARESQALVGILSAQLWHRQFLDHSAASPEPRAPDVILDEVADELTLDLIPAELR